jgi:tetratricopeptide (TPR) repeat protein
MHLVIARVVATLIVLAALLVAVAAHAGRPAQAHGGQPAHEHAPGSTASPNGLTPLFGNLGTHTHPISTRDPLAQRYFDEGLILTYGFNHAEAIRSFKDALTLDPACAICYWGIAYALGPNINAPMDDAAVPEAWSALQMARARAPGASPRERAYIEALATRYTPEPVADRAPYDRAFAAAMRELSRRYPDDTDAATIFAESLMDLTPWNFWTKDGEPAEFTNEIVATLESVLARDPNHPGANHFYIHAVEASRSPERALPSARRLETLVPGAGHLVHMPSHTYWRVGMYADAARINEQAIRVDESTARRAGGTPDGNAHGFYQMVYYPHNIHFLFAAAQMEGRSALALEAARKVVANVPDEAVAAVPALEDFRPMPLFALVRFGRWDAILAEPRPRAEHQYTTGIWHWARGLAELRQGRIERAEAEAAALSTIARSEAMEKLTLASFPTAQTLLTLAHHILAGEIAGARGDGDAWVTELAQAVAIQDGLPYIEPPSWFMPVRHHLGAALLGLGRFEEAEAVYREDLRQYPHNIWSLQGLAQAMDAQGKVEAAAKVQARVDDLATKADVVIGGSRY